MVICRRIDLASGLPALGGAGHLTGWARLPWRHRGGETRLAPSLVWVRARTPGGLTARAISAGCAGRPCAGSRFKRVGGPSLEVQEQRQRLADLAEGDRAHVA